MAIVIGGAGGNTISINNSIGSNNQYIKSNGSIAFWSGVPGETLKAWCNFTQIGTQSLKSSLNISGIADIGLGRTRITFVSGLLPDANYAVVGSSQVQIASGTIRTIIKFISITSTYVEIDVEAVDGGGSIDSGLVCLAVFR